MGKVEDALRSFVERRTRRAVREATGGMAKQLRDILAEVKRVRREVADLTAQARGGTGERAGGEPAGRVELKTRFSKRTTRSLRKRLDLTQKELARLLGVSSVTITAWESGKSRPRAEKLALISQMRETPRSAVDEKLGRSAQAAFTPAQIKKIRKQLGLSQAKMAKALGVSTGSVTSWESGRTRPGADKREAIARLAGAGAEAAVKTRAKKRAATAPRKRAKGRSFGVKQIKAIREKAALSQAKMAKKLGVSVNTISNWETGRSTPRAASLEKLAAMK